jgi:hypothetical protein
MGNKAISKMNDDNSPTTVPRKIVKAKPKAKYQRTKVLPQEMFADAVDDEQKLIQKTKGGFRHFIFTETSPAIRHTELVSKALAVIPGVYRVGTSYVLYAHDTGCRREECSHVHAHMGSGIHYHLMMRSNEPVLEAMLIKKTAADYVYIENSFYQVPVQCPLTTYYELYTSPTTTLLGKVGGGGGGESFADVFDQALKRGAVLKPLNHINIEPVWEAHKQSQILAQEQLIGIVNAGPYRSVLSQMLGALVEKEGSVSFEQHGWRLSLECGPTQYKCPCCACLGGGGGGGSNYPTETVCNDNALHEPPPTNYSTALLDEDISYEYMGVSQAQPMEYDLMEDLLGEDEQAMDATPAEVVVVSAAFRSLPAPVKTEETAYAEIPFAETASNSI